MIARIIIHQPDTIEYGIRKTNDQYIDVKTLDDLYQVLHNNTADHVHLEFGEYNNVGNFESKGEVIIPFKKGVTPYSTL